MVPFTLQEAEALQKTTLRRHQSKHDKAPKALNRTSVNTQVPASWTSADSSISVQTEIPVNDIRSLIFKRLKES